MNRWTRFLVHLGILLLAAGCRKPARPNVVVITIDTLRADRLGCYGFALAKTPAIDLLAREGVICRDAIAAAPVTMPSHATIFTGLHPPAHGVRDNGNYSLGEKAVTLAERLKKAGYDTQAFVSALVLNRRYNLSKGFDGYDDDLWSEDRPALFMIRERPGAKSAALAAEWIRRPARKEKPFFLWMHVFDPHQPYRPSPDVQAPSAYDGEIIRADRAVEMVVRALRESGVLDRTLIVFTADHGESLGEHGEKTHAIFVYDATVKVPLLFRYPSRFPKGESYEGPVRSVDIVPTILGIVGLPGKEETQGVDLTAALAGKEPPPDLAQYSESLVSEVGFGMAPLYALRRGGYKYIRAPRPELYDLRSDPRELHNLFESEKGRAASLDRELTALLAESARRSVASRDNPMSKETMETLMSLGYLTPAGDRSSMGRRDPKDGIAIVEKLEEARHLVQKEKWEESKRLLREILAEIPDHVSARNVLALALLKEGRLEDARREYLESLRIDPRQDRVLTVLGSIAILMGDRTEARRLFRSALEANPGFVEAMCNLGYLDEVDRNWEEARKWIAMAEKADPTYPRANRLSADLWYERGEWAAALKAYRKVLEVFPRDFESLLQAGNCLRRLGKIDEAEHFYLDASDVRPDSWVPHYNRACTRASAGKLEDAMAILTAAEARTGLPPKNLLRNDPDMAPLRGFPGFDALVSRGTEGQVSTL